MNKIIKILLVTLFLSLLTTPAFADDDFVVKAIQVNGLQRISKETVLHYLPVRVGQRMSSAKSAEMISALYQTGFFVNVELAQSGDTLIINVQERATIGSIMVTGNKKIDKDKLNAVLKDVGLVEGLAFDKATLKKVVDSLLSEYHSSGLYSATVTSTVKSAGVDRVDVVITISEGLPVEVKQIQILGNHVFRTKDLLKALELSTPNLFSFITQDDKFTQDKLDKSLEALRSYYLDRGYFKFKIDSTQTLLTPDKKEIYLVIRVTEGDYYTFKNYKLVGDLIYPESKVRALVDTYIKPGQAFSRKNVLAADNALGRLIGDQGYVFADINAEPAVDEATKQISLTIRVKPGHRVYIRRVTFAGNTKTMDVVLRRELRQMEGSLASVSKIKGSKRRLGLLGYLQNTEVKTIPVPGTTDQVDLEYSVTEVPSAEASAALSYGTDGFGLNLSVNQSNFMGTGKTLGIAFDNNRYSRTYQFNYNNPYYTVDGISRGFTLYSVRVTPGRLNLANFSTDSYGGSINYGIPISAKGDTLQVGLALQKLNLSVGSTPSVELLNFVNDYGSCAACNTRFNQALFTLGWNRNGFDRAIFPTRGLNQMASLTIAAPVGGRPLDYYKTSYDAHWYHPLTEQFILSTRAAAGYGNSYGPTQGLPFFQNYYAGGMGYAGAVRGYDTNSLGPLDSQNNPLGGNFMVTGSVGLVFPNFINPDRVRTTLFVDAGNVYNTRLAAEPPYIPRQHAGYIRCSTGLAVEWRIPSMGVLNFSLAKPLNPLSGTAVRSGDSLRYFDFSVGTSF